jgi:hypothetical protein
VQEFHPGPRSPPHFSPREIVQNTLPASESPRFAPDLADVAQYPRGMRHFAPPGTPEMSGPTRDALIVALRRKGFTCRQIGKVVGMSPGSVGHALERIAEGRPGRGPRC